MPTCIPCIPFFSQKDEKAGMDLMGRIVGQNVKGGYITYQSVKMIMYKLKY